MIVFNIRNGEPVEVEVGDGEIDYYDLYKMVTLVSDYYKDNFEDIRERLIMNPRKRALLGTTGVNDYNVEYLTFSKLSSLLSLIYEDVRDIKNTFGDEEE